MNGLSLVLHLLDGHTIRYDQPDPALAETIIRDVRRRRIFDAPLLSIAGNYSATGFATKSIVKIDFVTDLPLDWPYANGIERIVRIDEETFEERANLGTRDTEHQRRRPHEVGELHVEYLKLDLDSAEPDMFEVYSRYGSALDERRMLHQLFSSACLHAENPGVGTTLYNPHTIERIALLPGPTETPDQAWTAHYVGETEEEAQSRPVV